MQKLHVVAEKALVFKIFIVFICEIYLHKNQKI